MRSPAMRRIGVSGMLFPASGNVVLCGNSIVDARSTSSAKTLPSGPLPLREARLTPFSRAILLAAGDASTRPRFSVIEAADGVVFGAGGAEIFALLGVGVGSGDFASVSGDSPGARIKAILC